MSKKKSKKVYEESIKLISPKDKTKIIEFQREDGYSQSVQCFIDVNGNFCINLCSANVKVTQGVFRPENLNPCFHEDDFK